MKNANQLSIRFYFLLCIALLPITACSTRAHITEYPTQQESRISSVNHYCWADSINKEGALEKLEPTGGHHNSFDKSIRETINNSLKTKGYQLTDCSSANFMIDYRMGLHQDVAAVDASAKETSVNPYGPRWSIGDDQSVTYEGLKAPKENIIVVHHGTLHIAAFSNTNEVLWHISAERILNDEDSDETRKANLKTTIDRMMGNFPAKQ